MKVRLLCLFIIFSFLNACGGMSPEASSLISSPGIIPKTVLKEGTKITVTSEIGTIQIKAGKGNERFFSMNEDERRVILERTENAMGAEIGIYPPVPGKSAKGHDRVYLIDLEEALMSHHTLNEPIDFLWKQKFEKPGYDVETIYTDDGLVVQVSRYIKRDKPQGAPLHVNIWQVYVMGEKPLRMPGSQNDKIKVVRPKEKTKDQKEE